MTTRSRTSSVAMSLTYFGFICLLEQQHCRVVNIGASPPDTHKINYAEIVAREKSLLLRVWRELFRISREHPRRMLLAMAFLPRFLMASLISKFSNGSLFSDDAFYLQMVKDRATRSMSGWNAYTHGLWERSRSFMLVPVILYRLIGTSSFIPLLLSVCIGSLLVIVTYSLSRRYSSQDAAFLTTLCFCLMPSQILWSSLFLKDVYVAITLACIALLLRLWDESRLTHKVGLLGCIFILLLYLGQLRLHTFVVACAALGFAIFLTSKGLDLFRRSLAVGILTLLPMVAGAGILGVEFISRLTQGVEDQRILGAAGSATAVVNVPQMQLDPSPAASSNGGSISSDNSKSNASDSDSFPQVDTDMKDSLARSDVVSTLLDEARYLPSAIRVMLIEPLPGSLSKSRSLYAAFGEHLVWYPLLVLAAYGILSNRRRDVVMSFMTLLSVGLVIMWGLVEGNFGTAFRHRTEFVWIFFVLASMGINDLREKHKRRRRFRSIDQ